MSFKNKVVLVTGGSSGIGATAAIEFAKEGAHVAIVGRKEDKLKKVSEQCEKVGLKPLVIKADIGFDDQMKRVIDTVIDKFKQLDVLVNNAAIMKFASVLEGNILEAYDYTMNVNVRAYIHATMLAAPHLIKTKGNIINISSVAATALPAIPNYTPYHTSKAALNFFSRCTARELASHGVRVNIVSPGPVVTDLLENVGVTHMKFEDLTEEMPLNRVSQPIEIANIILFLASDKAVGITGSEFVADNGYLLKISK
ncbi:unnamed protein product [Colias eurytheme]|nr:unnamed protein product [Colias eurytheme]